MLPPPPDRMASPAELWRWLLQGGFSQPPFLAFLLALVLLVFTASCLRGDGRKKKLLRLPPSPPTLPFVGNLHQLSSLPHRSLYALSQKHGPIMLLRMGQVPTLVISSVEGAREVMKTRDLVFATRPSSRAAHILSYGSRNVAFAPYGEHWRQAKKAAVVHLLGPKKVQSFRRLREREVALMIEKIARAAAASDREVVDLSEAFHSLSNALVSAAVAGSFSAAAERNRMFREIIDEATALLAGLRLDDLFPSLAWLWSLPGVDSKLWKLSKKLDAFLNQVVDEHEHRSREEDGGASDPDFVDVLLSIHRNPSTDFSIRRDDIKAILMDLVAAGTDTSYAALEWAMAELVRNQRVMQRAQREVREVVGAKPVAAEDDVARMSYLRALTKEVLRLHPPAPLLLPRQSMEDTQVQGYDVPGGTTVLINAWAIARDPAAGWEAPEEFRPERFLDSPVDFRGNDFQFIPFGSGRRMCPGIGFAVSGIHLALANLLHRFDWSLPRGTHVEDVDMDEAPGITVRRKSSLRLVAAPRDSHERDIYE